MEQNFLKVVEPYEVVELEFVASKMQLSREEVFLINANHTQIVRKLSQMILDKKLNASLDQGKGLLVLLPPLEEHVTAVKTVETIDLLGEVVDALRTRAEVYNAKLQEMCVVCWLTTVIVSWESESECRGFLDDSYMVLSAGLLLDSLR